LNTLDIAIELGVNPKRVATRRESLEPTAESTPRRAPVAAVTIAFVYGPSRARTASGGVVGAVRAATLYRC